MPLRTAPDGKNYVLRQKSLHGLEYNSLSFCNRVKLPIIKLKEGNILKGIMLRFFHYSEFGTYYIIKK